MRLEGIIVGRDVNSHYKIADNNSNIYVINKEQSNNFCEGEFVYVDFSNSIKLSHITAINSNIHSKEDTSHINLAKEQVKLITLKPVVDSLILYSSLQEEQEVIFLSRDKSTKKKSMSKLLSLDFEIEELEETIFRGQNASILSFSNFDLRFSNHKIKGYEIKGLHNSQGVTYEDNLYIYNRLIRFS